MTRSRLLSVGVVSAVLAVAGCSSSDGSISSTSGSSTTEAVAETTEPTTAPTTEPTEPTTPPTTEATEATEPTTPTTTEPTTPTTTAPAATTTTVDPNLDPAVAADLALARTALLTLDDFPQGWIETPKDPSDDQNDSEKMDGLIEACLGSDANPNDAFLDDLKVETGEFAPPEGTPDVEQDVIMAPTQADALAAMTEVSSPLLPDCYAQATQTMFDEMLADPDQTDFPPGMTIGAIEAESIAADYGYPTDEAAVYFVHIPADVDGEAVDVYIEVWFMRQGRALSQMTFSGINELFPQEGIDELTATTFDRLAEIG